jgi:hypothetical protein
MITLKRILSVLTALTLVGCGGGGGSNGSSVFDGDGGGGSGGGGSTGVPTISLGLSNSTISSASPATVTATLKDSKSNPIGGQVVTFSIGRGLGVTNVATALTNASGAAVAILSPVNSSSVGADEVTATASVSGSTLVATAGFSVQATNVLIASFSSAVPSLGAYGQTSLTITLSGASAGSPVPLTVSSSCATAGKADVSPTRISATTTTVTIQYRDIGCGAIQSSDSLQAVIDGSAQVSTISLPIASPSVSSLAFISATPETIFLKGSGFTESSSVIFEVRDGNGSPLPNVNVTMSLLTQTGGVTMDGGTANVTRASDAQGRVTVRINSGTLPTPVRVSATIASTTISTVSSNLSVAVGLPSQLNFSFSQATKNIEAGNVDGVRNTYTIIASDRNGNPVPAGTSINFVSEGGQIEAIRQTELVDGLAVATANFLSSEPRAPDGRITITAYALGEESFLDLNGNNRYDSGEPFQDLGNIFKDRYFDGLFDVSVDEFVPLVINNSSACTLPANSLLNLNRTIPSVPATCDGIWSGAGQVYVRRALETVLSTSEARPLWASGSGLPSSCSTITLQTGPSAAQTQAFALVAGSTWYGGPGRAGSLDFIVADNNAIRLNPVASGSAVSASTPTPGLAVAVGGGSPVANTTEATLANVTYSFTDATVTQGTVVLRITSPGGLTTTSSFNVVRQDRPSACSVP